MKQPKKTRKPNQFQPGQVANPMGRPKGVPNKITTQVRETMHDFFMHNVDTIQKDFEALEPKDRLNFMAKLFPYYMPTMTATKIEKTVKHTGFEDWSTEKLQLILNINPPIELEDVTHEESE